MNPALTTQSGSKARRRASSAASHAGRSGWSAGRSTKTGMPACSARARAMAPGTSLPTATMSASSRPVAVASIRLCSNVPEPEASTTMRADTIEPYRAGILSC